MSSTNPTKNRGWTQVLRKGGSNGFVVCLVTRVEMEEKFEARQKQLRNYSDTKGETKVRKSKYKYITAKGKRIDGDLQNTAQKTNDDQHEPH